MNKRNYYEEKANESFQAPVKGVDSGAYGKDFEVRMSSPRKRKVSTQGNRDTVIYTVENGVKHRRDLEIKTNGGRIGKIIEKVNRGKDGYIVYHMNICNSNTKGKTREIPPTLFKLSEFVEILEDCGAIKAVNKGGIFNDYAIQVTSLKLYNALSEYVNEKRSYYYGKEFNLDEVFA